MQRARALFPGGVNSPVRAFRGVGGEPFVVERGEGSRIWDADGREYIDYVLSWGPLILGHAPATVLAALTDAMLRGTSFGIPTELEVQLGERIVERMPHVEMLRFVSSGTEATMSAVRVARAATGRDVILKFDGCYHGHADSFLVRAGSGVATLGLPNSPGVPDALAALTIVAPFNDLGAVESLLRAHAVAAIIVEPVVGNAGFIAPDSAFLPGLRTLADRYGALLIFDEVMTGFRIAFGGARERFGATPHLTTLGKVIGGGLPVAAYGGRADLMQQVAPSGSVYQAGTLSGNPLAMAAGIATLDGLTNKSRFARRDSSTDCGRSRRGAGCRSPPTVPARCGDSSFVPNRCARSRMPRRRTSIASSDSSTRRSIAASIWRRRRSKRRSCPRRTPTRTSPTR
jgi:glutamate-1-semialdehyde 2,1-aminomutase